MKLREAFLYYLSSVGGLSGAKALEAIDALAAWHDAGGEEETSRHQVLQDLQALGDLERDEDGYVYCAPPCLIRLPCAGPPRFVHVGQALPGTWRDLEHAAARIAEARLDDQVDPPRLFLTFQDMQQAEHFANTHHLAINAIPASWNLLNHALGLEDHAKSRLAGLRWLNLGQQLDPQADAFFDPHTGRFDRDVPPAAARLALERLPGPGGSHNLFKVYRQQHGVGWQLASIEGIDRDFAKWLVAREEGVTGVLGYSHDRRTQQVPRLYPPPLIYQRVLCLCSGYLPTPCPHEGDRPQLSYREVPVPYHRLLCEKLGQPHVDPQENAA